jgi:hypothetical protein
MVDAAERHSLRVVQLLLAYGADLNGVDKHKGGQLGVAAGLDRKSTLHGYTKQSQRPR